MALSLRQFMTYSEICLAITVSLALCSLAGCSGASNGGSGTNSASSLTFSPPAGEYTTPQSVTISTSTSGATIYYTTNGQTPTASSTRYSSPISVSSSEMINAITVDGANVSSVASADYIYNSIGIITTIAGGGIKVISNGSVATTVDLGFPNGLAFDMSGNLLIADALTQIVAVSPSGVLSIFAGSGQQGYSGDGGQATSAALNYPAGVVVDSSGNVYIADYQNSRVRKVSTGGVITTIAGNGIAKFSGDGGQATLASLNFPNALALDSSGNLYISDLGNDRIRKVSTSGIITTVVGFGGNGALGDGGLATNASLLYVTGLTVDTVGNLYLADEGMNRVRKVTTAGFISTIAGTGVGASSGDGGLATKATLNEPCGLALDSTGNLYISEATGGRVRKVSTAGIITTIAGNGTSSFSSNVGDGGPATSAELNRPQGLAVDKAGNLYISDENSGRVRKVTF